jgi:hypothetical protein
LILSFDAISLTIEIDDMMRPQTRTAVRVVTPDEYDAAARLHPALCPLVAAGDTRCGRRLLSEANADAARGFSASLEDGGTSGESISGFGSSGGGDCGDDGEPVMRLIQAARTAAQRLRRLATISAADSDACCAIPGLVQNQENQVRAEPGCFYSTAQMAKEEGMSIQLLLLEIMGVYLTHA